MGEPWSELDSHNVLSICTITNIWFYSCNPYSLNYFRKAHVCNFWNKQSCHWVNSWAFCTTNLRELWTGIDSKNKESHGIFYRTEWSQSLRLWPMASRLLFWQANSKGEFAALFHDFWEQLKFKAVHKTPQRFRYTNTYERGAVELFYQLRGV